MSVCLFFRHLVPVRANVAKLSMALPYVQRKVKRGLAQSTGVVERLGEISPWL